MSENGTGKNLVPDTSNATAADLTLRDTTLVQAQSQVDQMAATLSSSLSDQTTAGTAVTARFLLNPMGTTAAGRNARLSHFCGAPGAASHSDYRHVPILQCRTRFRFSLRSTFALE